MCTVARVKKNLKDEGVSPLRGYRGLEGRIRLLIDSSSPCHEEVLEEVRDGLYDLWLKSGKSSIDKRRIFEGYLAAKSRCEEIEGKGASDRSIWKHEHEREVYSIYGEMDRYAWSMEKRISKMPMDDPRRDELMGWALRIREKAEAYLQRWRDYWAEGEKGLRNETPGSSNIANSHNLINRPSLNPWTQRAPRGSKGMTQRQRRQVREMTLMMEKEFGVQCLSFGTLTVPPLGNEDDYKVAVNWSDLIRKFMQELKRQLERVGLSPWIVYANEVQTERNKKHGHHGLHCHFVIQGRRNRGVTWGVNKTFVKDLWGRVLGNLIGYEPYMDAATQLVKLKKSAANYLAKYISKTESKVVLDSGLEVLSISPSTWVGGIGGIKKAYKDAIETFEGPEVEYVLEKLDRNTGNQLSSVYEHYIELPPVKEGDKPFKYWVCTSFEVKDREKFLEEIKWVKDAIRSDWGGFQYPLRKECISSAERTRLVNYEAGEVSLRGDWSGWRAEFVDIVAQVFTNWWFMQQLTIIEFVGKYTQSSYPSLSMLRKWLQELTVVPSQ